MGVAAVIVALMLHAQAQRAQQLVLRARPVWPANGTITSPFGRDGYRWHPGIDIGTLRSLTVRAAQGGVVDKVGEPAGFSGYGNVVEVKAGPYEELYAHLSSFHVSVGQVVTAGEPIAIAGCTGSCTGTHLHFEVRYHDEAVSPFLTVLRPLVMKQAGPSSFATSVARHAELAAARQLIAYTHGLG
ncbi:MAG TPA: M23 family metallopeptidase [Gaiellaceae bacterium]|nr:M23 family metallopeptidase [Gaiellaceae bacterium]